MAELNKNYDIILDALKEKIRLAKQRAVVAVNTELLTVYWEIGNTILQQQNQEGWGAKVVNRLAQDLKQSFPDFKGLSPRNLQYMRSFAEAWPAISIVQPPVAQLQTNENHTLKFEQPLVAQIPWAHHIVILNKVQDPNIRLFYIKKTISNGWSKSVLATQIDSELHLRQGNAITNFDIALSKEQSDLARETFKNPYVFDFLGMGEEMQERELENALIQHIKKFMLELGRGFAYVGNQYNLQVENDDYFLDLLFFNYHLNRFVVFELKVGNFKPEFAGKLNFYINTIDEQIKQTNHEPTIGILLCKTPNSSVVKFALKGLDTPMGVAEYELMNALPKQLRGEMPTIEELEQELEKEIILPEKPIDAKRKLMQEILSKIKGEELSTKKNKEVLLYLFGVLQKIQAETEKLISLEMNLFQKTDIGRSIDGHGNRGLVSVDLEKKLQSESVFELGLFINMYGFKKAGTRAFDFYDSMVFYLHDYKYQIGKDRNTFWEEKMYHQQWTEFEIQQIAEKWSEEIIDGISKRLEQII